MIFRKVGGKVAFLDKDKFVEMDKIGATWLDRGAEAYRQGDSGP